MRADMGKVLVERPRLGRWNGDSRPGKGYVNQLKRCLAAGNSPPSREGMKRRHNRKKHFNEHLGPLRRFLDANVGRPWDKIYSEICQYVDRGNVVQNHILTHLFDYVVVHTVLIDGKACRGDGGYRTYGEPLRTSASRNQWYVCPKSGLLRKSKYVPWAPVRPKPPRIVKLNNKQVCVGRAGQWELITVALVSQHTSEDLPRYDAVLQKHIDTPAPEGESVEHFGRNRYTVRRRVLSRKELFGLPIPIDWLK